MLDGHDRVRGDRDGAAAEDAVGEAPRFTDTARILESTCRMRSLSPSSIAPLVLLLASVASAQTMLWKLPADTAVQYERLGEWTPVRAFNDPPSAKGVSSGGHRGRVQPVLLASELSEDRSHRERNPYDLYDLFPYLAFDLRTTTGGEIDQVFHRIPWVGDLHVTGTASKLGADGRQVLRLRVKTLPSLDPLADSAEFVRSLDYYCNESIDAELVLQRQLNAEEGFVESFQVAMTATLDQRRAGQAVRHFSIRGQENWRWLEIGAADGVFRARMQETLERARHHLEGEHLAKDDDNRRGGEGRGNFQGPTLRALELWAMARSGWTIQRKGVEESLKILLEQPADEPLTLAVNILAVDALTRGSIARPSGPLLRTSARERAGERPQLPRELGVQVDRWARHLVQAIDPEELKAGRVVLRFADDGSASTQVDWLGLFALDAASAHGFRLPSDLYAQAAEWLIEHAVLTDEVVVFRLELDEQSFLAGSGPTHELPVVAWARHGELDRYAVQASATCEALAALALCRQRLGTGRAANSLRKRCDVMILAGLGWLARHGTARIDAAPHPVQYQNVDDYRLALPFALEWIGVDRLDGRDWFFDAVQVLFPEQRSSGSLGDSIFGTAAALMILRPRVDGAVTGESGR